MSHLSIMSAVASIDRLEKELDSALSSKTQDGHDQAISYVREHLKAARESLKLAADHVNDLSARTTSAETAVKAARKEVAAAAKEAGAAVAAAQTRADEAIAELKKVQEAQALKDAAEKKA